MLNRSGSVGQRVRQRVVTLLQWGVRQCSDNDYEYIEQYRYTDRFLHEGYH